MIIVLGEIEQGRKTRIPVGCWEDDCSLLEAQDDLISKIIFSRNVMEKRKQAIQYSLFSVEW